MQSHRLAFASVYLVVNVVNWRTDGPNNHQPLTLIMHLPYRCPFVVRRGSRTLHITWEIHVGTCQAPTVSIPGMYPSLRLLSSFLTSSIEVAFAIACLTRSASSFVIRRPAFPAGNVGLGSSMVMAAFASFLETVVDIVVARAVNRPSGVRNTDLPVCRSYAHEL